MKYSITLSFLMLLGQFVPGLQQEAGAQTSSLSPWQIGFGVGYTNYSGDVSNYRIHGFKDIGKLYRFADYNKYYIDKPSLSVMIHKSITPTLGFMIQANTMSFAGSDRYRNKSGSFDTANVRYARSLNFRTSLQDVGLAFTFRTNNGKFLPENAFFSPSFFLGAGVSRFKVMGDLYDENNQPYNYRLPGNISDGNYESNLRDLKTETDNRYPNVVPYVDLGLGLNFRFSNKITLSVQSDIKYSASDYLDDVSGTYKSSYGSPAQEYAARPGYNVVNPVSLQRGDNNGTNDFYINNRVMLSIGLGKKNKERAFTAPAVYGLSMPYTPPSDKADSIRRSQAMLRDSLLNRKNDSLAVLSRRNDSLSRAADSVRVRKAAAPDDSVKTELQSIRTELKEIKGMLQDQQVSPHYQQLRYQADSLKALQNRISSQRTISREDNLQLRIYQLQTDSVRSEMQKLQQSHPELLRGNSAATLNTTGNVQPRNQPVIVSDTVFTPYRAADTMSAAAQVSRAELEVQKMKQDKRYKSDAAYRKNVDSMNKRLAAYEQQLKAAPQPRQQTAKKDTVISRQDQRRIDSLQRRMRELEQKMNIQGQADTSAYDQIRSEANRRIAYNRAADSEALNRNIGQLEQQLRVSNDSVSYFKRQQQNSNDSVAYYNQRAAALEKESEDRRKNTLWFQRVVAPQKTKERDEADQAELDRLQSQQRNFQQLAERNNHQIDDLQRRNRDLSDQYDDLNSNRNRQRRDNLLIQTPSPTILLDNTRSRSGSNNGDYEELQALRSEISRLRGEMYSGAQYGGNQPGAGYYSPLMGAPVTVPADITVRQPVTTPVTIDSTAKPVFVQDTAALQLLRSDLETLRGQLDSMKNTRSATPVKQVVTTQKFDVKSFPIVSVYFNSGSSVLSADQVRKLSSFAQVATKNPDANLQLKAFTDPVGNAAINESIARKRTAYVKSILTGRYKIAEARIAEEEPSISESGRTGKPNPLDRRVDLAFN